MVLLLCVFGVLVLTLGPYAGGLDDLTMRMAAFFSYHVPFTPAWMGPEDYGRLLNIAFFVPVGGLLAWWLGPHWGWATPLAVGLSLFIEIVQRIPDIGRDSSLDDVACNAVGASLGVVAIAILRSRSRG
ncbi:MAG: VanZ family protein [Nocardioides sp.]